MSTEALPHTIEQHPVTGMYNGKFGIWLFLASEVMLFGALFSSYILLRVHGDFPTHHDSGLSVPLGTLNTMILITSSVTMVLAWAAFKTKEPAKGRKYLLITAALALAFLAIKLTFEYRPKLHHYGVWIQGRAEPITGHLVDEAEAAEGGEEASAAIRFVPDGKFADDPFVKERLAAASHPAHGEEGHDHDHAAITIDRSQITRISNFSPKYSTFYATYYCMTGLHALHIIGGVLVILYFAGPGFGFWKRHQEQFTNRIECTGLYWHFVDLVWIFLFPVFYLL